MSTLDTVVMFAVILTTCLIVCGAAIVLADFIYRRGDVTLPIPSRRR